MLRSQSNNLFANNQRRKSLVDRQLYRNRLANLQNGISEDYFHGDVDNDYEEFGKS